VDLFAATLFLAGALLLGWALWLWQQWESGLANPAAVHRTERISLAGAGLMLSAVILYLAMLVPPLAIVALAATAIWLVACMRRSARRIHAQSDTVFRCTPEKAFALLAEPQKEPLYRRELERVELLSAGRPAVGTAFRAWVRIQGDPGQPGIHLVGEELITEYDPPRVYATTVVGEPTQTRLVFEDVADGTHVKATYEDVISVEEAVMGGVFRRGEVERRILKLRQEGWERARALLDEPAA
jgi:hypothetical protein